MKSCSVLVVAIILAGCLSRQESPTVDWSSPTAVADAGVPDWQETTDATPSPEEDGQWINTLIVKDTGQPWSPEVRYGMVHSPVVIISTPRAEDYFRIRGWLIKRGATGVILHKHCLTCTTTIYLSR